MDQSVKPVNGATSLADLIPRLANETIDLAKTELLRAKLEVASRSKSAIRTVIFGVALLVFGLLALTTLITASILSLGKALDSYGFAAFIVTGGLLLISGVCLALLKTSASKVTAKRTLPSGKTQIELPAAKHLAAEVAHARTESEHHGVGKQLKELKEQTGE